MLKARPNYIHGISVAFETVYDNILLVHYSAEHPSSCFPNHWSKCQRIKDLHMCPRWLDPTVAFLFPDVAVVFLQLMIETMHGPQ